MQWLAGLFTPILLTISSLFPWGSHMQAPPNQAPVASSTAASSMGSAAFNIDSLTSSSTSLEITGTCSNLSGSQAITILKGNTSLPKDYLPSYPDSAVYTEYTDHGGQFDSSCDSSKGNFSTHYDNPKLLPGTYIVGLYSYQNVYTDQGYQGATGMKLIVSAPLIIK